MNIKSKVLDLTLYMCAVQLTFCDYLRQFQTKNKKKKAYKKDKLVNIASSIIDLTLYMCAIQLTFCDYLPQFHFYLSFLC